MNLIKELQRIMDLPFPEDESKKKLVGTIMIVNGKPHRIESFDFKYQSVTVVDEMTGNTKAIKVTSLDVYLPESGVYSHPSGNYVLLHKIPKRQWLKSYSSSNYKMDIIGNKDFLGINIIDGIFDKKRQDFFVSPDRKIWFWDRVIGYIKDSTSFVCTNKVFKQELIDWDKHDNTYSK